MKFKLNWVFVIITLNILKGIRSFNGLFIKVISGIICVSLHSFFYSANSSILSCIEKNRV